MLINTKKTLEIRKNKPKQDTPFKCYIYCTVSKPYVVYNGSDDWRTVEEFMQTGIRINGKVIGEFICDAVYPVQVFENRSIKDWNYYNLYESCLSYAEMSEYIGIGNTGYAWHISNLVIYDNPKDLAGFSCRKQLTRPPQSWCYVDDDFQTSDIGATSSCYFCKNMYFCGIEWKCKLNHNTGKACSQYDEDVERKDAANQCLHLFDTKCS